MNIVLIIAPRYGKAALVAEKRNITATWVWLSSPATAQLFIERCWKRGCEVEPVWIYV